MRVWFGLASLAAACSFTPAGSVDADDDPDGGALVDADLTEPDGPPSPDAMPCVATCAGDVLMACAPTPAVTCAAGCTDSGGARCLVFQPSNGVPADFATGAAAAIVMPNERVYVFDTDDGSITSYDTSEQNPQTVRAAGAGVVSMIKFETRAQTGAPELAVWGVTSLSQPVGAGKIAFRGTRAAALIASGPIELHGVVDASGGQTDTGVLCRECAGPGGGAGATATTPAGGCAPGGDGVYSSGASWETGAAGGGMATQGASGGGAIAAGGAPAAITTCSGVTLEPLAGGGGGGRASMNGGSGGDAVGGGGGGALQLTSLERVVIDGSATEVYVGGIGGGGSAGMWGGGGGGAGGGIILEAPAVTIGGGAAIIANGGGGGAGRTSNAGEFGQSTATRAAGGLGDGAGSNNGRGGYGGITTNGGDIAARPSAGLSGGDGTGGGGGAAGRIRLNTRMGTTPTTNGAVVSPAASTGTRPAE